MLWFCDYDYKIASPSWNLRHLQLTKSFLKYGANPNGQFLFEKSTANKNYNYETPMLLAAKHGNVELIKLLLEHGLDLKKNMDYREQKRKFSVFLRLCYYGHFRCVEYLQSVCDINRYAMARDSDGNNALHHAIKHKNVQTIKYLLDNIYFIDRDQESKDNSNENKNTIKNENILQQKNMKGKTAVDIIYQTNSKKGLEMYKAIMQHQPQSVDIYNACKHKNWIILEQILKDNVNSDRATASQVFNINQQTGKYAQTPLMIAIENNSMECVNLLCENDNTDIDKLKESRYNFNALEYATWLRNAPILKILLKTLLKRENVDNEKSFEANILQKKLIDFGRLLDLAKRSKKHDFSGCCKFVEKIKTEGIDCSNYNYILGAIDYNEREPTATVAQYSIQVTQNIGRRDHSEIETKANEITDYSRTKSHGLNGGEATLLSHDQAQTLISKQPSTYESDEMSEQDFVASVAISNTKKELKPIKKYILENGLVVIVGIGQYHDKLQDLDGIAHDYKKTIATFNNKYNYAIFYQNRNNQNKYINNKFIDTATQHFSNKVKIEWGEKEILQFFKDARKLVVDNKHDGLIVIISSHGGSESVIYDSKWQEVELFEIFSIFHRDECPYLKNKPKLFFIDACRGQMKCYPNDQTLQTKGKQGKEGKEGKEVHESTPKLENNEKKEDNNINTKEKMERYHKEANFRYIYANIDGYSVVEAGKRGGYLIQAMKDVFVNDIQNITHQQCELSQIIQQMNSQYQGLVGTGNVQQIQDVNQMDGEIFFKKHSITENDTQNK